MAGIAANSELARRRQRAISQQVEFALVEPPAHVRELIGEPPVSGVKFARQWEELAVRLERHRLEYQLDVERDGPLGPEPSRIASTHRQAYEVQRHELASEIEQYGHARRLPVHEQAREIISERERDPGIAREL